MTRRPVRTRREVSRRAPARGAARAGGGALLTRASWRLQDLRLLKVEDGQWALKLGNGLRWLEWDPAENAVSLNDRLRRQQSSGAR